jgi:hypothetical protein
MEDDYQAPGRRAGRPSSRQGAVDLRPSCRESEHQCRHAGGVQPTAASNSYVLRTRFGIASFVASAQTVHPPPVCLRQGLDLVQEKDDAIEISGF